MKKVFINRISAVSMGKITAGISFIIGLVFVFPFLFFGGILSSVLGEGGFFSLGYLTFGLLFVLLLIALGGFINGCIIGWVFNVVAQKVGGLEVEVEEQQ